MVRTHVLYDNEKITETGIIHSRKKLRRERVVGGSHFRKKKSTYHRMEARHSSTKKYDST